MLKYGFEILEINRMDAEVFVGNIRSEKVLEKLGFSFEGLLRNWMYWNGQYFDIKMFSLLKKDYFTANPSPNRNGLIDDLDPKKQI